MPEVIYPGAIWDPGLAANYKRGRNRMEVVKAHYTVGVDSSNVGRNGYFQFLVSRDGTVRQFAEVDALCYDSGNFNDEGPGVEVEYYEPRDDAIFTDAARTATAGLIAWLHDEHGFPLTYFDVETLPLRVSAVPSGVGFISHRSLDQAPDNHTDYWPQADWDAMTTGGFLVALTEAQQNTVYQAAYAFNSGDASFYKTLEDIKTAVTTPTGASSIPFDKIDLAIDAAPITSAKKTALKAAIRTAVA